MVSGPDTSVDEDALTLTIQRLGLTYPQVRDRDLSLTRAFDVQATPTIVVLDGEGDVVYRGSTLPRWDALIDEL